MDSTKRKNLICDPDTGNCEPAGQNQIEEINLQQNQKVKLLYFTDPICSACWAIEPQLKKFKLEFGEYVDIEYKMGGLLPGWEGFADTANGISKPSDVAHHWDEVGQQSGMSIDGDIWLEDPLDSSYPPSIAFKAAQLQGKELAITFLRRIREMVFLEKRNITKEFYLCKAIEESGGNTVKFLEDFHSEDLKQSFYNEIQEGRQIGVRGFPTFIFVNAFGQGLKLSGMAEYKYYQMALEKILDKPTSPSPINFDVAGLLKHFGYMSTYELAFILSLDSNAVVNNLEPLIKKEMVKKEDHKFGAFWRWVG